MKGGEGEEPVVDDVEVMEEPVETSEPVVEEPVVEEPEVAEEVTPESEVVETSEPAAVEATNARMTWTGPNGNTEWTCTKNQAGGKRGGNSKKNKKTLYAEFLDSKYSKEELMKKCLKAGITVTVKRNGVVKPIKKETLIKKVVALKYK
jgi:hypothetical protein